MVPLEGPRVAREVVYLCISRPENRDDSVVVPTPFNVLAVLPKEQPRDYLLPADPRANLAAPRVSRLAIGCNGLNVRSTGSIDVADRILLDG